MFLATINPSKKLLYLCFVGRVSAADLERERREFIFLGLRTAAGISLADYRKRFGRELLADKAAAVASLQTLGHIHVDRGRLRLTPQGFLLADAIALELI